MLVAVCWGAIALTSGAAASPAPVLGANLDATALSPRQRQAELVRLKEAGARSLRWCLDWNRVEPEPGRFHWQADDSAVDAALAHGFDIVLVLGPCADWAVDPAWNVPADQRHCSIPQSLSTWRSYVRAAVGHFKGRVRYWQVREQPTAENFRGTRSEYLRLLESAAEEVRRIDAASRIIVPESGPLDIAGLDAFLKSPSCGACDVSGIYLPSVADEPRRLLLPLAVLRHEILGELGDPEAQPTWVLGCADSEAADCCMQGYVLAWAFGVERCYLPAETITGSAFQHLAELSYLGFLTLGPERLALAFEGRDGTTVLYWGLGETGAPTVSLAPRADAESARPASRSGGAPVPAAAASRAAVLQAGNRPVLLRALSAGEEVHARVPGRDDVIAARPGPDLRFSPMVYADYWLPRRPEFGLHNRKLRALPGGAVIQVESGGRLTLRTQMVERRGQEHLDNPWIYFDVDDGWLYFDQGKTRVAITIECWGPPPGRKESGFNIMYDSTRGYRFTRWQPVHANGWHLHRVELDDVSFANRDGYDFRVNAKGSALDLTLGSLTVEKLPAASGESGAR